MCHLIFVKLVERSIIPVMRASTAPVLPYFLLTLRDQPPEKIESILKPTFMLLLSLKKYSDANAQQLRTELLEGLYILSDKWLRSEELNKSLLEALSVSWTRLYLSWKFVNDTWF